MFRQDWEPVVIRKPPPVKTTVQPPVSNKEPVELKMYSKELADAVMKARCEFKMSQVELAKRVNVVPAVIQGMELRKNVYDPEITNRVLKILNIHVKKRFVV